MTGKAWLIFSILCWLAFDGVSHWWYLLDVLASDQFTNQFLVDGRLSPEVERVESLDDGEPGGLDAPFGVTNG